MSMGKKLFSTALAAMLSLALVPSAAFGVGSDSSSTSDVNTELEPGYVSDGESGVDSDIGLPEIDKEQNAEGETLEEPSSENSKQEVVEESDPAESELAIQNTPGLASEKEDSVEDGVKDAFDAISYVFIDQRDLVAGNTQNIVIALKDTASKIVDAKLSYRVAGSSDVMTMNSSNVVDNTVLFSKDFSASEAGSYELCGFDYTIEASDGLNAFNVELVQDQDVSYAFSISAAESLNLDESVGDVNAYALSEDGQITQESTIEEALAEATGEDDASEMAVSAFSLSSEESRAASTSSKIVIALDPGHGGSDPGAVGYGLKEKDLNWKIAQACKSKLESYGRYQVVLTRSENENPGLSERVDRAVAAGATAFISIHINSGGGTGSEVWIPNDSSYLKEQTHEVSKEIASSILDQLEALGLKDRGWKTRDSENVGGEGPFYYPDGSIQDYYTVIEQSREAGIPGIIIEHAFIDNGSDAAKLASDSFLTKLGQADAVGIANKYTFAVGNTNTSTELCMAGTEVTFSADVSGSTSGLTYNYVWRYGTDWSDWGSTVKSTGGYTSSTSSSFTAKKKGTYYVWVDVKNSSGISLTTQEKKVVVTSWSVSGISAPSTAKAGSKTTYSAKISGSTSGLTYNYVWRYGTGWSDWGSTSKSTGKYTSSTSGSFTPTKAGTYYVWVDVKGPDGYETSTPEAKVTVSGAWSVSGINAPSTVSAGSKATYSAKISGSTSGLTYNYVWRYGTGWSDWGSTSKSTGKYTSSTSGSFTPTKAGTYYVWVDVKGPDGYETSTAEAKVTVSRSWSVSGISAPSTVETGSKATYSAKVSGSTSGLTYNYVWRYGTGWSDWGSTSKGTGKYTSSTSGSFTPTKAGTYYVWVDVKGPDGYTVSTPEAKVTVSRSWSVSGINAPSTVSTGSKATYSAKVSGSTSGLTYNYVWRYGTGWSDWGSTSKGTGKYTSSTSGSFTPTKAGTYYVWVDVKGPDGYTVSTPEAKVTVSRSWSVSGISAPSTIAAGSKATYSAKISGSASGLTYNYVWRYGTGWSDWDSTSKSTGKYTSATSGSFTPTKPGTYYVWVDVKGPDGYTTSTAEAKVTVSGYSIMGASGTTASQMARFYRASVGDVYPSSVYSKKGAATIDDFCKIVYEEAQREGVKAEVLFSQAMHETGWLRFGGSVKVDQCNFGGLGAVSSTASGATFSSVRIGLRAQAQHLKAYGSTEPLNSACVDPRFSLVARGSALTVEDLGGKWAVPGTNYGTSIVSMITKLKTA